MLHPKKHVVLNHLCLAPSFLQTLLRFLRARKGDVAKAAQQFRSTRAWRIKTNVARFVKGAPGPFGSSAAAEFRGHPVLGVGGVELHPSIRLAEPLKNEGGWLYWGQTVSFGRDKQGRPIHLQAVGRASTRFGAGFDYLRKVEGLSYEDTKDAFIMGYVLFQEVQAARMKEVSGRLLNRHSPPLCYAEDDCLSLG